MRGTDFDRVRSYYHEFDEWGRFDTPAGHLEFEIVKSILSVTLPRNATVLDLGGGPGRYAFHLAEQGHRVHLADISHTLIDQARSRSREFRYRDNLVSMEVVNALDLSQYADQSFSVVLLFGPLYHLNSSEAVTCLQQVYNKLSVGGLLLVVYMPFEVGVKSIFERSLYAPDQVDADAMDAVLDTGAFRNVAAQGFQEGFFHKSGDLRNCLEQVGFTIHDERSIRGIGFGSESEVMKLKEPDPKRYQQLLSTIDRTCRNESIRATCGHAIITCAR